MGIKQSSKEYPVEKNTFYFSESSFEKITDIMYMEEFEQGARIFWEGDPVQKLFYVKEGSVQLSKLNDEGKDLTLYHYFPGDLFGEFSPSDNQISTFTAQALEDCKIGVIQQADLEVLLWQNGDLAIEFAKWQSLIQRSTELKIRDLLFHGKNGALASTLIRAANTYGIQDGENIHISRKFTNNEISSLIGATRETVNRMLSKLKSDGLISYENGRITITDLEGLKLVCNCEECPLSICRL
ncbi:fumarate/nitrate reduction transcriptional regulator Fnr [Bacillus carboniphilus]|uniref:Fumarate/nitrate reduction transcriptional regulator Fnr n=1 Tax=Bacillus carboniphilus TaxID=86663 RepID=A0ABN0W4E9_9BACI